MYKTVNVVSVLFYNMESSCELAPKAWTTTVYDKGRNLRPGFTGTHEPHKMVVRGEKARLGRMTAKGIVYIDKCKMQ